MSVLDIETNANAKNENDWLAFLDFAGVSKLLFIWPSILIGMQTYPRVWTIKDYIKRGRIGLPVSLTSDAHLSCMVTAFLKESYALRETN